MTSKDEAANRRDEVVRQIDHARSVLLWTDANGVHITAAEVVDAALIAARAALQPAPIAGETNEPVVWDGLSHETVELVDGFADALKAKLRRAEVRYGYEVGWRNDGWEDECRRDLLTHVTKGDPLDVAAYAAFCWFHKWSTTPSLPAEPVVAAATARESTSFIGTRPSKIGTSNKRSTGDR
jgi:hypothetical protein